jgi:hypothetical protein
MLEGIARESAMMEVRADHSGEMKSETQSWRDRSWAKVSVVGECSVGSFTRLTIIAET